LRISFLQTGFEEKRHVPHHHCFFSFFSCSHLSWKLLFLV
jgi:hypothetical protein